MGSPCFRFKQFTVFHDHCAMKVGTDGVLLGAWSQVEGRRHILDIGTGTGLIALMAAQRNPTASVTGIDIEPEAVEQANENVLHSPFSDRIRIVRQDILSYNPQQQFDCILCNPPFYTEDILPPEAERLKARNVVSMPFAGLIERVGELLCPDGTFSVIIPFARLSDFVADCLENGLYLTHRTVVRTTLRKAPKRVLLTFSKARSLQLQDDELVLTDAEGNRSTEYQQLARDFYLH